MVCVCMCLEVDHVTKMCTNMAGINSVTSRENDLLMESVQAVLLEALFANARRVDVRKFRVENMAILRLGPRKLLFLLF